MALQLTRGAVSVISSGNWQGTDVKPVLQVLEVRVVQPQSASSENKERYRLVVSDGLNSQQGMLSTQLNDLVRSQRLQSGSIVRLNEFVTSNIRDRVIIIIMGLDVIVSNCDIIGELRPSSGTPGGEPSTLRPVAPMQPINQPTRTMGGPQNFMASVPRPNFGVNSPNYQQEHNAGLQSFAMPHASTAISRPPANSYMCPAQPAYNQPRPMYMNRGPTAKNDEPPKTVPIAALNPYRDRWMIKVRVTAKAEFRRYSNAKGESNRAFSFDLVDHTVGGGEIRATCFNDVGYELYNQIEVGEVYFVSEGQIIPVQKASYDFLKNDHEIRLDHTSTIWPCFEVDN